MSESNRCLECGFPLDSREHVEGKGKHDGSLAEPLAPPEPTLTITRSELDAIIAEAVAAAAVDANSGAAIAGGQGAAGPSAPVPAAPAKPDLSKMNRTQLLATAAAEGVTIPDSMVNKKIADAIRKARRAKGA